MKIAASEIDLTQLPPDQLKDLGRRAGEELERREFIRDYALVVDINHKRLQEVTGVVQTPGEAWVEPHPLHPATAYTRGATVTHEGKTYVSLIPMNMLPPTTRAWKQQPSQ